MKSNNYRKGVGAVILNKKKQILMAERVDKKNAWQMPQGGIENNESNKQAILRELLEEIGTNNVEILYELPLLYYDFIDKIQKQSFNKKYIGQAIVWFVMLFKGKEKDINLKYSISNIEFANWRWEDSCNIVNTIADFKKDMYRNILQYLNQNNII